MCGVILEFGVGGAIEMQTARYYIISTYKQPTVGFEPTTTGLQNQSSTVELRWHNYSRYTCISTSETALFYIEPEIVARKLSASCAANKVGMQIKLSG
jgi:hypothetical protein